MQGISPETSQSPSHTALNYSGILVVGLVGSMGAWSVSASPLFPVTAILAAVLFILVVICIRFSGPNLSGKLFVLQAFCIAALIFLVPSDFIYILTVVWLVQAVQIYSVRTATILMIAALIWFAIAQLNFFGLGQLLDLIVSAGLYSLLNMFAISMTQLFTSERLQKEQLAELNRDLIATRDLLSQSSAQSERLRISRDLHDILGHHMTALILNLEVATHRIDGEPKEKVEQSLALAKLLLSDLRSTVSELREEGGINLEESINALVSGIPNFDIDVDFSKSSKIDDVEYAETFLRCAQEAVTNVLKHSDADRCRIEMNSDDSNFTLSVSDNGKAAYDIEPGNGLKGMAERVKALGGELSWQCNDGGFQLTVFLGASQSS